MQYRVGYGDGGFSELQVAIRVHGNAVEYVPIGLILLLFMEMNGALTRMVHVCGIFADCRTPDALVRFPSSPVPLAAFRNERHRCSLLLMVLANLWYMPRELVFSLR